MDNKKSIKDIVTERNQGKITLDDYTLGIAKNPQTGMWTLVEIPFNVQTGDAGKPKILYEDIDRSMIIERFKVEAVQRNIIG